MHVLLDKGNKIGEDMKGVYTQRIVLITKINYAYEDVHNEYLPEVGDLAQLVRLPISLDGSEGPVVWIFQLYQILFPTG